MHHSMVPGKEEYMEAGTERKILEAAGKVFMKKGRLGTSMQDIADEAGINRTLLHYYFRNKEKLFETIFTKILASAFPVLIKAFMSDRPLMEKIRMFVDTWTDMLKENPYLPLFVIQEISLNPDRLAGIIQQRGFDPDVMLKGLKSDMESAGMADMDPRHLIVNMLGMVIFPYIVRPLFMKVAFRDDEQAYDQFLEDRREQIPRFIHLAMQDANTKNSKT